MYKFEKKIFLNKSSYSIKGFTLVELLISVGIILMITAFTLPGFGEFSKRKNFDRVVYTFASDMNNLRARAVAGARPVNSSISVQDGDLWGVVAYCTDNTTIGYSGLYYPIYARSDGSIANYGDYGNLNRNQGTGTALKYRFDCPSDGPGPYRFIFFDKFTGLGSSTAGEFASEESVTLTITMDSTGWSRDVVIYKTGVINVL